MPARTKVAFAKQVRAPKTAELIAGQLRSRIVRGELKPGMRLPTESELMVQFGVSRPTLREASGSWRPSPSSTSAAASAAAPWSPPRTSPSAPATSACCCNSTAPPSPTSTKHAPHSSPYTPA